MKQLHLCVQSTVKDHPDEGYKRHVLDTLAAREKMVKNETDINTLQQEIDHLTSVMDGTLPNAADFRMPINQEAFPNLPVLPEPERAVKMILVRKLAALKLARQDESVAQFLKDQGILK